VRGWEWLFAFDVRGLQGFGDTSKVNLLECSLSCGSKHIPWVVARDGRWTQGTFELWLGLTSVVGVSVRVVARTDGS